MFNDIMGAINGTILANFLVLLIGAFVAVGVGIVLNMFVFGPKANAANAGKFADYANGKRFLPLSVIRAAYYSIAVYLVFMGIGQWVMNGYSGINGFIQYTFIGNVVLRIAYECVLAVRKIAGLDTKDNTADEPKVNQPLIQPNPVQPTQQYQQPVQPQYQQPQQYQNYQQPVSAPAPQPVPAPAPQPVPAPVPQPVPEPVPAPVPAPVEPATPAQPEAPATVFCGICGKQIKADAKFCPFCGTPRQ